MKDSIVITIAPINVSISFGESKRCDGAPLRAEKFRRLAGYDIPEWFMNTSRVRGCQRFKSTISGLPGKCEIKGWIKGLVICNNLGTQANQR